VNKPFFHAVRDDPAPESLRSDLWGLVHYSYVLKAHQFPVEWILLGNLIAGGVQGGDDDLAVDVGLRLWNDHRDGVTQQDVAGAMLRNMAGFRETGGVFPRLQTWFR
jgi:hypothetical protein